MTPETLIKFRRRFNLTQAECAKALYVSPRSISNWENATNPIPGMLAYLMSAYALNIPEYDEYVVGRRDV